MIDLRFHPLTEWAAKPTPAAQRKSRWSFRAGWNDTLALLEVELDKLGARDVIVSAALRPDDIRIDGWPRSNAMPTHPGIILSFASKHGPLRYLTDRYEFWQHNLRAIALGLEALRAVDRYGITERGEQYVGWKAIPQTTASRAEQKAFLFKIANETSPSLLDERQVYRKALIAAHPDHGGSRELLEQVQNAGRMLGVG